MPTIAECGGFLYLQKELEDAEGQVWEMTGVLDGSGFRTNRLQRFGYAVMTAKENSMLFEKGESIPVHEFHYWDCTENGSRCRAVKPDGKRNWDCVEQKEAVFAGFPHISYDSCPDFAKRFVKFCLEGEKRDMQKENWNDAIKDITLPDEEVRQAALARWNQLAKPLHGWGNSKRPLQESPRSRGPSTR